MSIVEGEGYRLIEGDCLQAKDAIRRAKIIIADPPYGIDLDTDYTRYPGGKQYARIAGDGQPFDFSPWADLPAREQFWFGAENYINLPPAGSWLCWDKYPTDRSDGRLSGGFEMIWSKQRHKRTILRIKAINTSWLTVTESVGHPTQKPVELLVELIERFTEPGDLIADPYMGSGSTGVAAIKMGRQFIGCEIDPHYFGLSCKRIADTSRAARGLPKQLTDDQDYAHMPLFMAGAAQ